MNLLDEYTAHARIAAVREHAETGLRRRSRRARRHARSIAESRYRPAPPSG